MLLGVLLLAAVIAVLLVVTSGGGSSHRAAGTRSTNAPAARGGFVPASVTVAVLNGTDVSQLAHRVEQKLSRGGYKGGTVPIPDVPVKITVSEAAAVKLTAKIGTKTVARAQTTLTAAGSKTVKLALNSAGRKALRQKHSAKVKLSAAANDAAGNRGTAQATVKLHG